VKRAEHQRGAAARHRSYLLGRRRGPGGLAAGGERGEKGWRSRPPPAVGIGSAAATMGKIAAIQARHRRDWSGGPSPVPMEYEAAEQAATQGPVRAAATRRGGGPDASVLWSVEGIAANTSEKARKFWVSFASRGGEVLDQFLPEAGGPGVKLPCPASGVFFSM
jgi:hypothetical protein